MKKSVTYSIRVKEEDVTRIEEARKAGSTLVNLLKTGAEAVLNEKFKTKV